jgi:hypothetical protein
VYGLNRHLPKEMRKQTMIDLRDGGHEQLVSNSVGFKPAFAKRDEKQTIIDLRRISTNWFKKPGLCPSIIGLQDCGQSRYKI